MKTIAVPLLLAGSAQAQTPAEERRARALAADRGVPAPTLIADAWQQGDCTDTAVTAAAAALASAETALSTKKGDLPALETAQATALTDNTAAVTAVITAEAAVAAAMKTDDDAEKAKVGLQKLLDDATYEVTAKTAAKATADAALTAATTAESDATTLHSTLSTAATNAATAYSAATTARGTASTTGTAKELADAETAWNTENGQVSGLQTLATNAKTTWDASLAITTVKLEPKTFEDYRKTKAEALRTTATTGTTAIKTASATALTTATAAGTNVPYITAKTTWDAKGTAWQDLAKLATAGVKAWIAIDETQASNWSALSTCDLTSNTATMTQNAATTAITTEALCEGACKELKPWTVDSNGIPTGAAATTGTGYCYAYAWTTGPDTCKHYQGGVVPTTASTACKKRVKTDSASGLWTKIDNAAETKTPYQEFNDQSTGAWYTALKAAYENVYTLTMQKEIDETVDTDYNTWLTGGEFASAGQLAYWTALNDYASAKSTSDTDETDYNTKNGNLTTKQAVVAGLLAVKNAKNAADVEAVADEARKLVLKNRADAALSAQATVKTAAETAKSTAATAATAAATALTTATTAQTTAQNNYNTQATAATNAAAPDLTALTAARATALTKAGALDSALTALANAQGVADAAQVTRDSAKAAHLAAIVACKEAKFDQYAAALETAKSARTAAMATIETLVDAAEAKRPAAGAAGARCEKAPSNGTRRPARGETTCATGLCCGAASGALRTGGRATAAGALVADSVVTQATTTVTIETCQPVAATEYAFRPPRAPMATAEPATVAWAFACIEGAQKLAAAASALATAAYVLA